MHRASILLITLVSVCAGGLALVGASRAAGADIYSYTDADGVVHFTNITPSGKERQRWKKVVKEAPEYGKAAARRGDCQQCDVVPARDRAAAVRGLELLAAAARSIMAGAPRRSA